MSKLMMTIFLAVVMAALGSFGEPVPEIYSNECITRGGMANFFVKAESGQDVRVGYLGGSITAQKGYRLQTLEWFKKLWSGAQFSEINAAIGGTGSQLGVFRLAEHVLKYEPDLVFIEFAVNDNTTDPLMAQQHLRSMEGIVRQIIKHNRNTDICLIYTLTYKTIAEIKEGKYPLSVLAHEQIASHYNLPSINLGLRVIELEKEGKLVMQGEGGTMGRVDVQFAAGAMPLAEGGEIVFSKDGVHPFTNSGHLLYTYAIMRAIERLREVGEPQTRVLPEPLNEDNFEDAKMVDVALLADGDGWYEHQWDNDLLPMSLRKLMPNLIYTCLNGDSIKFDFKGRAFGLFDVMGPSAGSAVCFVDGRMVREVSRFDSYCTYYRGNSFVHFLDEPQSAQVKIELGKGQSEEQKMQILSQRHDKIAPLDAYRENCLYVGKLLLIGELQEPDRSQEQDIGEADM